MGDRTRSPETRFWAKVDKGGLAPEHRPELGPCWLWIGGKTRDGYGVFSNADRRLEGAHRFSCLLAGKDIPVGFDVDHLCRNPPCVNPDHLEPVSRSENIRRGIGPATLARRNRAVTHCPQGHRYDKANTYVSSRNERMCRTCNREKATIRRARRAAVAAGQFSDL